MPRGEVVAVAGTGRELHTKTRDVAHPGSLSQVLPCQGPTVSVIGPCMRRSIHAVGKNIRLAQGFRNRVIRGYERIL
jgi:hypothetical protein